MRVALISATALMAVSLLPVTTHTEAIDDGAEAVGSVVLVDADDGGAAADDVDAAADVDAVELDDGAVQCAAPDTCWVTTDPPTPLPWTDAHVRDALLGQPVMTRRIVYCEIGRSGTYDPYSVGSRGEIGPAQLLPGRGNGLSIFYAWGYSDPHSPYQAVAFINEVQARGMLGSQYPRTSRGCAGSV